MYYYCPNPSCKNRRNEETKTICSCGNSLLIGGKYRLVEPLCNLTDSKRKHEVFKAYSDNQTKTESVAEPSSSKVVLKFLIQDDEKLEKHLVQEADFLTSVSISKHPGFPELKEVKTELSLKNSDFQKLHYFVMEYIDGKDLEQWLQNKNLIDRELVFNWLRQLAEAVKYMHEQKRIHRDLKASNVMVEKNKQLKLIDFGTVKQLKNSEGNEHTDTIIYSQGYSPLDQYCLSPRDNKTRDNKTNDIHNLGRLFVHLLTGRHPDLFFDDKCKEKSEGAWKRECREDTPKQLLDLIDRMMSRSWEHRPEIAQVIREIDAISKSLNPQTNQSEIEAAPSIPPQTQSPPIHTPEEERAPSNSHQPQSSPPYEPYGAFPRWNWQKMVFGRWNWQKMVFVVFSVAMILMILRHCQSLNSTSLPDPCIVSLYGWNVNDIAYSPNGKAVVTVSSDNAVRAFKVTDGNKFERTDCELHGARNGNGTVALQFKPSDSTKNETIIATASLNRSDGGVKLWNLKTDGSLSNLKNLLPDVPVVALAFSPQGSYLAIATSEKAIKIYDMNNLDGDPKTIRPQENIDAVSYIKALNFSPNEKYLTIVVGLDNETQKFKAGVWNWQAENFWKLLDINDNVVAVAFNSQGDLFAQAYYKDTTPKYIVEVSDLNTDPIITNSIEFSEPIKTMSLSQDGNYLVTGLDNKEKFKARVWERHTKNVYSSVKDIGDVVALAFSPTNSNLLALAQPDKSKVALSITELGDSHASENQEERYWLYPDISIDSMYPK